MFEIIAKHENARAGLLKTKHGSFETPVFLPVATKAVIKTLTPEEVWDAGCRGIIVNALHLYRRALDKVENAGGIHDFMGWKGFVLSDSGGFQPIKKFPCEVENDGVAFSMPDGRIEVFTPEKSMEVQEKLRVDIALSLDDCPSYPYTKERVASSVDKTIEWAGRCQGEDRFAILQGGTFEDERARCAKAIGDMKFDGFAIGGLCIGEPKEEMHRTVKVTLSHLPENKPRHLMGVGSADDIVRGIKMGVDIFDSAFPTRNARHGTIFTDKGRINLGRAKVKGDAIQEGCNCYACRNFSLDYLNHLFKEKDPLGPRLATIHNLFFTNRIVEEAREKIKEDSLFDK